MLYPLKFRPLFLEKIWGGHKIEKLLGKNIGKIANCGESWELSGIDGKESVVTNGYLADNTLPELVEVYMGDLVGEKVFDRCGNDFPLLVKFIDAQDDLSVQVHPDDELAMLRYGTNGKTEMWYVVDADEGSGLYVGFKEGVTKQQYLDAVKAGTVDSLLVFHPVKPGDVFFIPAGTVHAIGKGVMVAEIQQSSDVTYRIFDWNRVGADGKGRQLHTLEAEDALHFDDHTQYAVEYERAVNKTIPLVNCKPFNVNVVDFDRALEKVYAQIDSFVLYVCLEGSAHVVYEGEAQPLAKGEVMLVPAIATELTMVPEGRTKMLEVYIG